MGWMDEAENGLNLNEVNEVNHDDLQDNTDLEILQTHAMSSGIERFTILESLLSILDNDIAAHLQDVPDEELGEVLLQVALEVGICSDTTYSKRLFLGSGGTSEERQAFWKELCSLVQVSSIDCEEKVLHSLDQIVGEMLNPEPFVHLIPQKRRLASRHIRLPGVSSLDQHHREEIEINSLVHSTTNLSEHDTSMSLQEASSESLAQLWDSLDKWSLPLVSKVQESQEFSMDENNTQASHTRLKSNDLIELINTDLLKKTVVLHELQPCSVSVDTTLSKYRQLFNKPLYEQPK